MGKCDAFESASPFYRGRQFSDWPTRGGSGRGRCVTRVSRGGRGGRQMRHLRHVGASWTIRLDLHQNNQERIHYLTLKTKSWQLMPCIICNFYPDLPQHDTFQSSKSCRNPPSPILNIGVDSIFPRFSWSGRSLRKDRQFPFPFTAPFDARRRRRNSRQERGRETVQFSSVCVTHWCANL